MCRTYNHEKVDNVPFKQDKQPLGLALLLLFRHGLLPGGILGVEALARDGVDGDAVRLRRGVRLHCVFGHLDVVAEQEARGEAVADVLDKLAGVFARELEHHGGDGAAEGRGHGGRGQAEEARG